MPDVDGPSTNVPSYDKIVPFYNEIVLSIHKQDRSLDSTSESRQLLLCCTINYRKGLR